MVWVGIDIGGTNTRVLLVNDEGRILGRVKMATRRAAQRVQYLTEVVAAVSQLVKGQSLAGIGIGVPGLVQKDGLLNRTVNCSVLADNQLRTQLEDTFRVPVRQGNDATMAALGEHWLGAGAGRETLMMLTIGTGLGSGLILQGVPYHGAHGFAVECGHLPVVPDGIVCPCGNQGCLEQYVSASALARFAGTRDAAEAAQRAAAGDPQALAGFETMGGWLGIGLCGIVNLFDPDMIVIGGGVSASFDLFMPAARRELVKRSFNPYGEQLSIVPAACGDDAGALGAVRYVMQVNAEVTA